jgi:hypothetical protein
MAAMGRRPRLRITWIVALAAACTPPPATARRTATAALARDLDGVYATWRESLPAGEVVEIERGRFRYHQYCDPDPDQPFVPEPVTGTIEERNDIVTLRGPDGWCITRRHVRVGALDLLLRAEAYQSWKESAVLPLLGVAVKLDGVTFEDADAHRRPLPDRRDDR